MRLIDADALLEAIEKAFPISIKSTALAGTVRVLSKVLGLIKDAPTVPAAIDWIPFRLREMTEEERKEYPPEITGIWCEPLPDHGQEILVSDGKYVWDDTFYNDDYCYLDGGDDIKEGMAWMPKPKAYQPKENDE